MSLKRIVRKTQKKVSKHNPLESIGELFARNPSTPSDVCIRCGAIRGNMKYNRKIGLPHPICQVCYDELTTEGRFQWMLMLMADWVRQYRDRPIDYLPPHSQARYRDLAIMLEQWRRILFEPDGGETNWTQHQPQFGPDHLYYQVCYGYENRHEFFPIPPLELQICIHCRGWFDMDGQACVAWEGKEQHNATRRYIEAQRRADDAASHLKAPDVPGQCNARWGDNRCSCEPGHQGPHGMEVAGGIVIAPWPKELNV